MQYLPCNSLSSLWGLGFLLHLLHKTNTTTVTRRASAPLLVTAIIAILSVLERLSLVVVGGGRVVVVLVVVVVVVEVVVVLERLLLLGRYCLERVSGQLSSVMFKLISSSWKYSGCLMEMKIGVSFLFQFSILPDFNKAYKASLPLPTRVQFLSCCEVLCSVLIRCHFGTHQRPKFHKREGRREKPNLLA